MRRNPFIQTASTDDNCQSIELDRIHSEGQPVSNSNELESESDNDQRCGFGFFSPEWIQPYATKRTFLVIFTILSLVQGAAWSYLLATISTLQKQFKISSQTTGITMTGNEISQVLFSVCISYFGGKGHRPRWISVGIFAFGLSCFLTAAPQFLYGSGEDTLSLTEELALGYSLEGEMISNASNSDHFTFHKNQIKVPLCKRDDLRNRPDSSIKKDATSLGPLLFIFIGQFMFGIGNVLFFSLGGPYLDDNTSKVNMPRVMGMTLGLRLLGPSFGYLIASGCLKLFVNPLFTPIINQEDPRWIGAWWLGWIILGTFFIILAFLTALFPKRLRRKNQVGPNGQENRLKESVPGLKEMRRAISSLAKNKINVFNTIAGICYLFTEIGFATYMSKYVETIFMQTASNASIISGTAIMMFRSTGMILSGFLISKYKPSARFLAGWNVVIAFTTVIIMIYFTQLGCKVGTLSFGDKLESGLGWNLTSECNSDCNCDTGKVLPVCHEPSKTVYYSACHAGCTAYENDIITNCTCIQGNNSSVKTGNCSEGCGQIFILFLVLSALIKFSDVSGRLGNLLVSYRCVDKEERSLSIGIHLFLASLLAFVPAPIVFGKIFDTTCIVWSGETEPNKGNCLQLRYVLNLTAAGFMLIGGVLDTFVWYFVKDVDLYGETETQNNPSESLSVNESLLNK